MFLKAMRLQVKNCSVHFRTFIPLSLNDISITYGNLPLVLNYVLATFFYLIFTDWITVELFIG